MDFIVEHLMELGWTVLIGVIAFFLRSINNKLKCTLADIQLMKEGLKESLHEQIVSKCKAIIDRGYVTTDELDEIHAINKPYEGLKGNGTAKTAIIKVKELPLK